MDERRDALDSAVDPGMDPQAAQAFLSVADRLFDEMVRQQHRKVVGLAREVLPYLSEEDLRNPWDFVELKSHPTFEYEDGLLNGLIAAQVALRAEIRQRLLPPTPPPPVTSRG